MFIELIDGLRCTADHRSICLVAAITKRDDRQVIEGTLGCPTCRREYPIRDGVVWFGERPTGRATSSAPDADGAMRIGAFLAVSEGITVALVGDWAQYANELAELVGLRAFAINPPTQTVVAESERVGVIYSENRVPFKASSLRGVAIGDAGWSAGDISLATRVLSAGGRMVAPAILPVPDDIEEIARNESVWVGEKRGALVSLHRR